MKRTNLKAREVMKLAHEIKSCFHDFAEALTAAWMFVKSGIQAIHNRKSRAIGFWCDRFERARREECLAARAKAKSRKQSAMQNVVKQVKNNAALKANKEKMKAFRKPKFVGMDSFYDLDRNHTEYEMDVYF